MFINLKIPIRKESKNSLTRPYREMFINLKIPIL